ncbi:MAG TPA: (d)CMP kinase, partial [Vicinamibacteria bacterium]|nr:(d)CMP kinase [Vicinamibacteria bacterium]
PARARARTAARWRARGARVVRRRGLVIAIDGPSGAGKSTAGRVVAARLGYVFLDTGAMYRALALKALRSGADLDDGAAVAELARAARILLTPEGEVQLDGDDVTAAIRTREVSTAASRVSVHPPVRKVLVALQQAMGREGGIVMDGRDIGSAVFPDADVKFYVDADARRRALRRSEELRAAGHVADVEAIAEEIRARDHADSTRAESPLTRAKDALHIDTTDLDAEEVVARMMEAVEDRLAALSHGRAARSEA